jgi:hypothetical protein
MASAAPILGQMLVSTAISKIGQNQGWHPALTAGLGILGGAGVGSAITGGMAASAAQGAGSLAGSTAMSVNPHAGFGIADIAQTRFPFGMSATPHRGMGVLNEARGTLPYPGDGAIGLSGYDGPIGFDVGDGQPLGRIGKPANQFFPPEQSGAPTYMDKGQQWRSLALDGAKDKWTSMWADKKFATSMGSTFIEGMFADEPKKQPIGGGGGGGGGGSAPAYQGGGAGGQYQVVGGFPGRAAGPQWKEIA